MIFSASHRAACATVLLLATTAPHAWAQSQPGWFVPPAGEAPAAKQATGKKTKHPAAAAPAAALPPPPLPPQDETGSAQPGDLTDAELQQKAALLPQPPAPKLPDIISSFYAETATGDAVKVSAIGPGSALPAPLDAATTYYVIRGDTNTLQLSDSATGSPIVFTTAGAGTLHLTAPLIHTGQTNVGTDFSVTLPDHIKLLAGGSAPPIAAAGVLGVPDVMRMSSAAQAVDKVIGARKEKLQAELQHAQATWRQMEQELQSDAPHLSREQGLARERTLRDRVTSDRHALQEKNRIIQEAAQVALGQIERTLIGIIRQVAESRGMNLVLHRSQVALNVQEFDITDAVAAQLNRALPTVQIPPEDVDPATLPKDWGTPAAK